MSNSFFALVILSSPLSSPSSMSASLNVSVAFSDGMPVQIPSSACGTVFPGHCSQPSLCLQVSVARQYNLSNILHVTGEFETVVMPLSAESNFSCISIHMCMLPILAFLLAIKRGHFRGHFFLNVTLNFPTDAALHWENSLTMLSNKLRDRKYLYLLLECLPKPEKLKVLRVMLTLGSVTSKAPGAFHLTVYLTERKMQVSF
mmetsp:Transcript_64081/g.134726  ORF Transcript_64081/g.134726 Transcript_64081/m.134726 type:complete len:202 (-) Transcript_64081:545-1150(-)